ncbi:hypothetical protein Tco_1103790 [Tanacetum coccineum]
MEVSRLSGMDNDLFTYEVEVANIPCNSKMDDDSELESDDDMGYDPSDIRGDDEVELTDEESSNNVDEFVEVFRINTNIFNYETPLCSAFNEFNYLFMVDPDLLTKDIIGFKTYEDYKDDWIYEWNKDVPWVDEKPWTNTGVWTKPTPVKHTCKPFNYKTGCSEWPHVAVKEVEYDDLTVIRKEACRAYQEIFRIMDEGWKSVFPDINTAYPLHTIRRIDHLDVTSLYYYLTLKTLLSDFEYSVFTNLIRRPREGNINEVGGMHIFWNSMCVLFVLGFRRFLEHKSAIYALENLSKQTSGEFLILILLNSRI